MTHNTLDHDIHLSSMYENYDLDFYDSTTQVMTTKWPISSQNSTAIILVPSSSELIYHKSEKINHVDSSKNNKRFS